MKCKGGILASKMEDSETIQNQFIDCNTTGIYVSGSSRNNKISENIIVNSTTGIYLSGSSWNNITTNAVYNSTEGIVIRGSNYCLLFNNSLIENEYGIQILPRCSHNELLRNILQLNTVGLLLDGLESSQYYYPDENVIEENEITENQEGIYLRKSDNNEIYNNTIRQNQIGIHTLESENNKITRNTITHNQIGLYSNLSTNRIEFNSFSENNPQVVEYGSLNHINYNWWIDWLIPDENSDGFVDNPYPIAGDTINFDYSPLSRSHVLIPPILFLPKVNQTYYGILPIFWQPGQDTEGHNVTYDLYYSADNGLTWLLIIGGRTTNYYEWDISNIPNGTYTLKIIIHCSEGLETESYLNGAFKIESNAITTSLTSTYPSTTTIDRITPGFSLILALWIFLPSTFLKYKQKKRTSKG